LHIDPADVGADDWTAGAGELAVADDSTDAVDTVTGINRAINISCTSISNSSQNIIKA